MNNQKSCKHCGDKFYPMGRVSNQTHCSKKECQRARKKAWLLGKLKGDTDYKENKKIAQNKWKTSNRDYWRCYKNKHKSYTNYNREMSRERAKIHRTTKSPTLKHSILKISIERKTLINLIKNEVSGLKIVFI